MFCLLGEFIEGIMEENEVMEIVSASRRNNQASTTRQFIGETIKHQPPDSLLEKRSSINRLSNSLLEKRSSINHQTVHWRNDQASTIYQTVYWRNDQASTTRQFIGETIKDQPSITNVIIFMM